MRMSNSILPSSHFAYSWLLTSACLLHWLYASPKVGLWCLDINRIDSLHSGPYCDSPLLASDYLSLPFLFFLSFPPSLPSYISSFKQMGICICYLLGTVLGSGETMLKKIKSYLGGLYLSQNGEKGRKVM